MKWIRCPSDMYGSPGAWSYGLISMNPFDAMVTRAAGLGALVLATVARRGTSVAELGRVLRDFRVCLALEVGADDSLREAAGFAGGFRPALDLDADLVFDDGVGGGFALGRALALGLAFGFALGLGFTLGLGFAFGFAAGLALGLVLGLGLGLGLGFALGAGF